MASTTIKDATVWVMAKRVAPRAEGQEPERIVTVQIGDHEWDIYVPETEFELAMGEAVEQVMERRQMACHRFER